MDRDSAASGEDYYGSEDYERPSFGKRAARCLRLVPWMVFLTVGVFVTGVVFWLWGTISTRDSVVQLADAIGVDGAATSWISHTATTVMVAVTIGGSIIMALALLLSLVRGVERGLLLGICVGGSDKRPEPWLFRGYQVVAAILNALVWLLLAATVGVVAAALISWGGFAAVSRGIDAGVSAADVVLSPAGVTLSSASDLSARVASALGGSPLAALVAGGGAGSGLPFTPVCAPVCLNAGSFAAVLRMAESCVCGGARLDAARAAAGRGAKAAGAALGGSLAIWISASLLTLILTGHHVTAGFDRKSARYLKEQRAEEYDMGYAANPKDCVIVADAAAAGGGDAGAGADQTPTLRIIKQRAAAGGV